MIQCECGKLYDFGPNQRFICPCGFHGYRPLLSENTSCIIRREKVRQAICNRSVILFVVKEKNKTGTNLNNLIDSAFRKNKPIELVTKLKNLLYEPSCNLDWAVEWWNGWY